MTKNVERYDAKQNYMAQHVKDMAHHVERYDAIRRKLPQNLENHSVKR